MLNYVISFILNNYEESVQTFILIVHLKRNFDTTNKGERGKNKKSNLAKGDKIYSQPDVDDDNVNQMFIDNLNGKNISLKDILNKSVKELFDDNQENINLKTEFTRTLTSYIYKKFNNNNLVGYNNNIIKENYIPKIVKYFEGNGRSYKEDIIEAETVLIGNDLKEQTKVLIPKIFEIQYINKSSVDIISIIIDYIKENIFNKYLTNVFDIMEDNNFLTTLLFLYESDQKLISEDVIEQIKRSI